MRFTLSRDIYLTPDPRTSRDYITSASVNLGSGLKFGQGASRVI